MAGGDDGKTKTGRISLSNSYSTSSSASSSEMDGKQQPPKDFVCPISGRMMADPVIIPNGETFERGCIQAYLDQREEEMDRGRDPSGSFSPATPLVPNLALRSTIFSWCDSHDVDRPRPILRDEAVRLVESWMKNEEKEEKCSVSALSRDGGSTSDSSEIVSPVEEEILAKLKSSIVENQSEGLVLLRETTRNSEEERTLLCTQTLLLSLRPFLFSRLPNLQSNAVAAVVNLSLHRPNKSSIIRSGVVPSLVSALKTLNSETRSHAVAAIFSLSTDESCRAAIGALGALPPLLNIFSKSNEDVGIRRDAGLAIYHLSMTCSANRSKLVRMGAGKIILAIVSKHHLGKLVGVSLKIVANLARCSEGRAALMDAMAVEVVVDLLRKISHHREIESATAERRERCVEILYGFGQWSLRFRGLAKATGADEVLRNVPEMEDEVIKSPPNEGGGETKVKKMVEKILSAMSGEKQDYTNGISGDSRHFSTTTGVSDPGVISPRRRDLRRTDIQSSKF
ncbi:U-box domain-containing protein [Zostera marina]|uniref:RING-type E3 ubiquitin transferase n=1 Tax=Zostera marina TaxID=29655 RepID=A0A0K9NZ06_ZOSMR|nr:U-box domain-containing protein [Zostera marina]